MQQPSGPAPSWFKEALAIRPQEKTIQVDGCPIHFLAWGDPGRPGLVLIHGSGAHAHWWDFIAPFFIDHYRVLALDLGGMGDSGYRSSYSVDLFAKEIWEVVQAGEIQNRPILIGHSFGGYVALRAGIAHGEQLTGVVLVDSPVRPPDYEWEHNPRLSPIRPKKIYPNLPSALERFRLVPPQECANAFILQHIAHHSLKKVEGGWCWKFDENLFRDFQIENQSQDLSRLLCRVGVIYGEKSRLFSQEVADYMFEVLGKSVPFSAIPEAEHHLFLDQPLAFVAALRTLLAEWRHSKPSRKV